MAEIRVENLRKEFGAFVAVQDSTFVVEDGDPVAPGQPLIRLHPEVAV